ncbi:tyrosine-type recombinase/integrase [Synechococcus elongatus]|uniref:tyrosine-type recombinase/integrase n=1 Tax=Synechococcus elongatus TaxID=32046 RepID=UPI003CC8AB21
MVWLVPKVERSGQSTVLNPEQIRLLLEKLPPKHRLVAAIAYYTAARIGEVLQLRAEAITAGEIVFVRQTTKTRTTRTAKIPTPLVELLTEYRQGPVQGWHHHQKYTMPRKGWLFIGADGQRPLSRRAFDAVLRRTCTQLNLDTDIFNGVSTHSFRRSAATTLHLKGVPLQAIARVTGHASLSALQRYLDVHAEQAARAVELL